MKNAFVFCTVDLHPLEHEFFQALEEEPIVCWSLRQVEKLRDADAVYFVFSRICVGSSVFALVLEAAFQATEGMPRWIIRLDDAVVPPNARSNAAMILKSLPDGRPKFIRRPNII